MRRTLALVLAAAFGLPAAAQDVAAIRRNIAERMPDFPRIDEIGRSPVPGLYEIRAGQDIYYTDEQGQHLIEGHIVETRTRQNLTRARLDKLAEVDPAQLPLKDAIVWKQGNGARKLYVFADPNCGYCKRFERDLNALKDVTVYTFLYPILGGDSPEKSRNIWCAKDSTKAWRDWMLDNVTPTRSMGACDAGALQRNAELGRRYRIQGTPAIVFDDGHRVAGAMTAAQLERQLVSRSAAGRP